MTMPDIPDSGFLSQREVDRHYQRLEMLMEFTRLFDYCEASERAIAIIGPAFLDTLLSEILTEFMVNDEKEVKKLLQPEGHFGTYGGRVTACYCLGLVGPIVVADLRLVGKIRNLFAHELRSTFDDPKIGGWCKQLRWHRECLGDPPHDASHRGLFQVGINQLVSHLNGIPGLARFKKRSIVEHT